MPDMTRPARAERHALAATAAALGPDAPTLCDPWSVADLLAHLVLREGRPDLALGLGIPLLAGRLEQAQRQLAAGDFDRLVERVRSGPPAWHPTQVPALDDVANLFEFFVHHEDLRRASGKGPRPADADLDRALAGTLKRAGRLLFRRAGVGVTLVPDHGAAHTVHRPTGAGAVRVAGPVGELVLYAFGRRGVAQVRVDGPERARQVLATARLGLS